jgi:hypothetical protein
MGGLWDVQDILGFFWGCFGRLVLGMLNRQNDFGTCLGCVFGMFLGHVCDIFPFPKHFPKLCCCGNPSHKLIFWETIWDMSGTAPALMGSVFFGDAVGLCLGVTFGRSVWEGSLLHSFETWLGSAWDIHAYAYICSRGLFWKVPYLSDLGNTFGKCWGHV